MKRGTFILLGMTVCLMQSAGAAEPPPAQSSGWRGDGSGRFPEANPPIEWNGDTGKNILWKTKVGLGKFSSPTLVNGKIFVVSEPARLICMDADSGKILWEKPNDFAELPGKVEPKPLPEGHENTTPTPVSDGQFVYAAFGTGIVACYDLQGQRQWIRHVEAPAGLQYGRSCSPVLLGGKLIVGVHFTFALDAKTGQVLWKNEDVAEGYGTPLAARIGGVEMVITPSGKVVRLSDGKILAVTTELPYASPIIRDDTAYFIGPVSSAISLAKSAVDPAVRTLWKTDLEGTFFASPILHAGLLYTCSNEGVLLVLNAADGKIVATREIEIGSAGGRPGVANANIYPSLVLAGKYLFLSNDIGETLVLEPGREFRQIRRNDLGDGFSGAPVFAGKRMYVRAKERLYCIEAP